MTRRPPVQKACQRCRVKRAKCDGKPTCSRCKVAGERCEYDTAEKVTKSDLRSEILRLEKIIRDAGIGSDVSRANDDNIGDSSVGGDASPEQQGDDEEMNIDSVAGMPTPATGSLTSKSATTPISRTSQQQAPLNEPTSFSQLLSWRTCQPSIKPGVIPAKKAKPKTALYLPPLPPDTSSPSSHLDTWTTTGWTKDYVRHMFDAVGTWDYMAFSVLYRDAFLRDYYDGSTRFCSSALVHAVLALANILIHGDDNAIQASPSSATVSRALYQEANTAVLTAKASKSLPDIQSLGIMALYQLRGGQEQEAHQLARLFLDLVLQFCEREPTTDELNDEYFSLAKASTYCGAVSLVRITSMATGQIFNVPVDMLRDTPVALDSMFDDSDPTKRSSQLRATFVSDGEPYDAKVVAAKLFQLVEWSYSLITSSRIAATPSVYDAQETYSRLLDWYRNFFVLLNAEGSRTPFILFAHICYHFALMCAFRPFIGIETPESEFRATDLCAQAAQSILALVQSYDDMFTLQRVPGMLPYFVLSAGLFGLAVEDSGSHLEPAYVLLREQVPAMKQVRDGGQEFEPNLQGSPANASYVQVSMVDHARFLLQKIASTHVVAKLAISKLKEP